jgi:hypothetical protein
VRRRRTLWRTAGRNRVREPKQFHHLNRRAVGTVQRNDEVNPGTAFANNRGFARRSAAGARPALKSDRIPARAMPHGAAANDRGERRGPIHQPERNLADFGRNGHVACDHGGTGKLHGRTKFLARAQAINHPPCPRGAVLRSSCRALVASRTNSVAREWPRTERIEIADRRLLTKQWESFDPGHEIIFLCNSRACP